MHTKHFRHLAALLVLTLLLAACAGAATEAPVTAEPPAQPTVETQPEPTEVPPTAEPPAAPTEAPAEAEHAMALVLLGVKDDNSFAQAGYDALQRIGEEKGIRTAYSESVSQADAPRVMREYIDQGFDIIIAHTALYQDAVFEVAAEHPEVNFAWPGGIQGTAKNVADYDQPFYQPAYLIGILAGYMSKSSSIGALSGFDIPVCHAMGEAFRAGAQTVKPDINYVSSAVGNFQDISKAQEAALAQADTAGVDYWIACGPGPAVGSIEAARQVGGYTTGYVSDMSSLGEDVVLTSVVWRLYPIFERILEDTENGTFDNPWYQFGVAEDAPEVGFNPALQDRIPAEAVAAMQEAEQQIRDGTLEVPYVPVEQ